MIDEHFILLIYQIYKIMSIKNAIYISIFLTQRFFINITVLTLAISSSIIIFDELIVYDLFIKILNN